jgi:molybdopterin synthase catalytic subunit
MAQVIPAKVLLAQVGEDAINADRIRALVNLREAGAVVMFSGDVRDHDHGRAVTSLTYEGHPTAQSVLLDVAQQIAAEHPVLAIAVVHRVGPIAIGESALVAAVSSAHRGEAFAACSALVDLTKERLPVWKHQVFADGTDEWVNCA